jgi:Ca2+/Na+ antiporter
VAKAFFLGGLFLFVAAPTLRESSPQTILWAAPAILIAAMIIAWAAESAQFFIAQGFALAILAWMQTLPEFAMEAVFAWRQQVPFLFASLTGALRLLTGLGWPMIYCAAAVMYRRREREPLGKIVLEGEHSVQVIGLLAPLIYISFVAWKGSLHLADAVVLTLIYAAYLAVLGKMPPQEEEGIEDLERIPRAIVLSPRARRIGLIGGLFVLSGLLIYLSAEPFLGSLFAISTRLGIPTFIFVQWVAPFVSEFPEGLSTFYWARTVASRPHGANEPGVEQHQSVDAAGSDAAGGVIAESAACCLGSTRPTAGDRGLDDHRPAVGGHAVPGEHGASLVGSIGAIRVVVRAILLFSGQPRCTVLGPGCSTSPLVDHD